MDELTRDECLALLEELPVAHVATIGDGEPYVTPISFVINGGELVFRTLPGRRLAAIRSDGRVCIEASRSGEGGSWESVIAWGTAYEIDDVQRSGDVVAAILAKYRSETESPFAFATPAGIGSEPRAVAVPLETISGRNSGTGFNPRTRPGRL